MAINPDIVNIINIEDLANVPTIYNNDYIVIGRGIKARKSTVIELYNTFGIPSILSSISSLENAIANVNQNTLNSVSYLPQSKTDAEKATARNNINVLSASETLSAIDVAVLNNANVVNYVHGVNVDNTDPKHPIIEEFRPIDDYNNDMLLKADIDGNLTIGGIWWQDQVLSDRFTNYKQVLTALTNNTIEWGNVELDKHIFLVDDADGLKVKVNGSEGVIWNSFNLTNVSQLNNDAGYLQANDLDGYIYDVQYNSSTHEITFYLQNEPNIVIDLPIEQLIKGVQLVGDDLVFTFEDGSTVTVPLNTLLVGVVKKVNGLTPNSQGEVVLNIADIPSLSSELANKLDIRMAGLVSNLTQAEKDAILTKLGVVNNIVQVLGLSGNTITLSNGGGSVSLNIANIGGLQSALDGKANANGDNITNIQTWRDSLGIGTLNSLTTTDKSNLVNAINEVNSNSSKGISTTINQGNNWYRIAKGTLSGGLGCSFIIIVERGYGNNNNESYTFSVNTAYNGKTTITQLSGTYNTRILTHLRVVNTITDRIYVDIKYNATNTINPLSVKVLGSGEAIPATIAPAVTTGVTELETTTGVRTTDDIFANKRVGSINGFEISGRSNSDVVLAGGGHRPVSDFALSSSIITPNNGLLTISTSSDLTGSGTFSADQATASNVNIGLSSGTLASLALADSSLQIGDNISELVNDVGYITEASLPNVGNGNITYSGIGDITGGGTSTANQSGNTDYTFDLTTQTKSNIALGVTAHGWGNFRNFGLGTQTTTSISLASNRYRGFYEIPSNDPNLPTNFGGAVGNLTVLRSNHLLLTNNVTNGVGTKLFYGVSTSSSNIPANWVELWHTGNFNPAQYVLQTSLNTQLANYVPINGVTTINNTKTFTSSPIVPNATLDSHAVNLGQLNSIIDNFDFVTDEALNSYIKKGVHNVNPEGEPFSIHANYGTLDWNGNGFSFVTDSEQEFEYIEDEQAIGVNPFKNYGFYLNNQRLRFSNAGNRSELLPSNGVSKSKLPTTGSTQRTLAVGATMGESTYYANTQGVIELPEYTTYTTGTGISILDNVITNTAPNATHTGDVTGSVYLSIANNAVTNPKMAPMNANSIKGRAGSIGNPQDLTPAQVRTMLNIQEGANRTRIGINGGNYSEVGDINLIAGSNVSLSKSGNNITINSTSSSIDTTVKLYMPGEVLNNDTVSCDASKTIIYLSSTFTGNLNIAIDPDLQDGAELNVIHTLSAGTVTSFTINGNLIDQLGQFVSTYVASQRRTYRFVYVKDLGRFALVGIGNLQ